jgi:hypothetical protein
VHDIFGKWVEQAYQIPEDKEGKMKRNRTRVIDAATLWSFAQRLLNKEQEKRSKVLFPYCFSLTGATHLEEKTAGALSLEITDVKSHDWCGDEFLVQCMADSLSSYYAPWVVKQFIDNFYAPALKRSDTPGVVKTYWSSDWRYREGFTKYGGNKSGNPCTSLIAKTWGVIYGVIGLVERGCVEATVEDITLLLKGIHPKVGLINGGDNIVVVNRDTANKKPISDYVRMVILDPAKSFMGMVPLTGQGGSILWLPNPESAVKKFVNHDYSINSNKRPFWAHGWFLRQDYYASNPAAVHAISILNKTTAKHFGYTIDQMADKHFISPDLNMDSLTDADRDFLFDPAYIHYRLDADDVSPELLRRVFKSYTPDMMQPLIKGMAK